MLHHIVCDTVLFYNSGPQHNSHVIVASVLFAVHAVHTDAVASVVGRAEILAAIAFQVILLGYFHAVVVPERRRGWVTTAVFVALPLATWMAVLFKEQSISVLGACAVVDVVHHSGWFKPSVAPRAAASNDVTNLVPRKRSDTSSLGSYKSTTAAPHALKEQAPAVHTNAASARVAWCRAVVCVCLGALLAHVRLCLNTGPPQITKGMNPAAFSEVWLTRVLTFNHIAAQHLWLLVFPYQLCADWSHGSLPLVTAWGGRDNVFTALVYVGWITVIAVAGAYRRTAVGSSVVKGIAIMLGTYILSSNLVFYVGFVVAERVLFLPSMGFSVVVSGLFGIALQSPNLGSTGAKAYRYTLRAMVRIAAGHPHPTHTHRPPEV